MLTAGKIYAILTLVDVYPFNVYPKILDYMVNKS